MKGELDDENKYKEICTLHVCAMYFVISHCLWH